MEAMYASDLDPKLVEEIIEKIARAVSRAGMEMPAILLLSSITPLSWVGSQFGRALVAPLFGLISWDTMNKADLYFMIFEERGNIRRLIKRIEELAEASDQQKEKGKTDGK